MKDEIIEQIENRILDEHKKHAHYGGEWAKIASCKIYNELNITIKNNKPDPFEQIIKTVDEVCIDAWEHSDLLPNIQTRILTEIKNKTYTEKDVIKLMTSAWVAGFCKYEIVEAGLESRETDIEVDWILRKYDKIK